MRDAALTSALEKAGGPSALARHLGITPAAVIQWKCVPPGRVIDIERYTGVSRHILRPDIFGALPATTGEAEATHADAPFRAAPASHSRRNSFDLPALQAYLDRRPFASLSEHAWDLGISKGLLKAILGGEEPPEEIRAKIETRIAQRDTTPCEAVRAGAAA